MGTIYINPHYRCTTHPQGTPSFQSPCTRKCTAHASTPAPAHAASQQGEGEGEGVRGRGLVRVLMRVCWLVSLPPLCVFLSDCPMKWLYLVLFLSDCPLIWVLGEQVRTHENDTTLILAYTNVVIKTPASTPHLYHYVSTSCTTTSTTTSSQ